jgi:hypothetical protein
VERKLKKEVIAIRKDIPFHENSLPPFTEWTLHANAKVKSAYEVELNADNTYNVSSVKINVNASTEYTFSSVASSGLNYEIDEYDSNDTNISNDTITKSSSSKTFTTMANTSYIGVRFYNSSAVAGTFTFTNPQLELGDTASSFVPKGEGKSQTIKERLKGTGIVEQVNVRFYPGVERALRVAPYVLEDGRKPNHLFTYPDGTTPYITGDNDYIKMPVTVEIENDDILCIDVENTSGLYNYTLSCDVVISYNTGGV